MAGNVPAITETSPKRIVQAIRDLFAGRSNAVGEVTLTASSATTVVNTLNVGVDTKVFLMATTANAAAEAGGTALRISSVGQGTFTITHANNAQTDRTFFWVALG
jgi:hypothetical protein